MIELYAVNAGYRKSDIDTNWYYVLAHSIKEARQRFSSKVTWLDVYKIVVCDDVRREDVLGHPDKYIVI